MTFFSWMSLVYIIFFIHPQSWKDLYYIPFLLTVLITFMFTISLITHRLVTIILIPLGIVLIISIRIFLIKDLINPILVLGLIFTLIYFFTSDSSNVILPQNSNSIHKSISKQIDNYADLPQTNRPKSRITN